MLYDVGNPGPCLGQTQNRGGVKQVNGITTLCDSLSPKHWTLRLLHYPLKIYQSRIFYKVSFHLLFFFISKRIFAETEMMNSR